MGFPKVLACLPYRVPVDAVVRNHTASGSLFSFDPPVHQAVSKGAARRRTGALFDGLVHNSRILGINDGALGFGQTRIPVRTPNNGLHTGSALTSRRYTEGHWRGAGEADRWAKLA